MNKIEPIKISQKKPGKPQSRLSELASAKVVSAGEAFASDLSVQRPVGDRQVPIQAKTLTEKPPVSSKIAVKRTFRYPKEIDSQLKKFVHKYNLEKHDDDPELTMEEVGMVMVKFFLTLIPEN